MVFMQREYMNGSVFKLRRTVSAYPIVHEAHTPCKTCEKNATRIISNMSENMMQLDLRTNCTLFSIGCFVVDAYKNR